MLLKHLDKCPIIDTSAFIAPNATICGDVKVGKNTKIMYGAIIIAKGGGYYVELEFSTVFNV